MSEVLVLYFFQGEPGESVDYPNAFLIPSTVPQASITFAKFIEHFPLKHKMLSMHFRFKTEDKNFGYVWTDIKSHTTQLPVFQKLITAKVLIIDDANNFNRKSRLRRKKIVQGEEEIVFDTNKVTEQSFKSDQTNPKKYQTETEKTNSFIEQNSKFEDSPSKSVGNSNIFNFDDDSDGKQFSHPSNSDNFSPSFSADFSPSVSTNPAFFSPTVAEPVLSRDELKMRRENATNEKVKHALEFKQEIDETSRKESEEFEAAKAKYDAKLTSWAYVNAKEKRNIRNLLTTLHTVLWADNTWKTIGLGDVIEAKQVKLQYRKAMLVAHPDRCSGLNAETRFVAKRLFEAINEAYQEFLKKEGV